MLAVLAEDAAFVAEVDALLADVEALLADVLAADADAAAAVADEPALALSTIKSHFALSVLVLIGCAPLDVCEVFA